jgi:hypothetical protein
MLARFRNKLQILERILIELEKDGWTTGIPKDLIKYQAEFVKR